MSSKSKSTKKLAIINSQNTARSLKFTERPHPVNRTKHDVTTNRLSKQKTNGLQDPVQPFPVAEPRLVEEVSTTISMGVHSLGSLDFNYHLTSANPTEDPSTSSTRNVSASSTRHSSQYQQLEEASPSPSTQYLNPSLNPHLETQLISRRVAPTPIDAAHDDILTDDLPSHNVVTVPSPSPVYSRSVSESALLVDKKLSLPNQSASDPAVHSVLNNIGQCWSPPSTTEYSIKETETNQFVHQSSLPAIVNGTTPHDEDKSQTGMHSISTPTAATTHVMQDDDKDVSVAVRHF